MNNATTASQSPPLDSVPLHPIVVPSEGKYIKNCHSCGKYLRRNRRMLIGGYDYNQNKRPICWDCDASYE